LQTIDLPHAAKGAADMRDGNGTSNDERDVEGVNDLFAGPAFFGCTNEVVGNAIVAAENGRGDQTQQFLSFAAKSTGFVGLVVEREVALDAQMAAAEDFFVKVSARALEVVK
jgi:hypothetical protein